MKGGKTHLKKRSKEEDCGENGGTAARSGRTKGKSIPATERPTKNGGGGRQHFSVNAKQKGR